MSDTLPLNGVRVIDLTRALAGPFCTTILADLGADVIKVETLAGDMIRQWGPHQDGVSLYHVATNRNKRSLALDARTAKGAEILRMLLAEADVLVENFRPGVLESMGLTPAWFDENAPELIVTSVSGFGPNGPQTFDPCFDQIVQGMSGLMSLTGEVGNEFRVGIPIADILSGMFAAIGVTAALAGRARGGNSRRVETSLLESLTSVLNFQAQGFLNTGTVPAPAGNDHPVISPYGLFRTADRPLNIAAATQKQFESLCGAIGSPELIDDIKYVDAASRMINRPALQSDIEERLATAPAAHWLKQLRDQNVPVGPVHDMAGLMDDPQFQAIEMLATVEHPALGEMRTLRGPLRMDGVPTPVRLPAPELGQHTIEILREIGVTDDDVYRLLDDRAIGACSVLTTSESKC